VLRVLNVSCIIIFVGIVLTFGDRLEEVTVKNVGSIKTAVIKANKEADEIFKIRKHIENQANKINLVATEAKLALNNIKAVQDVINSMKMYGSIAKITFDGQINLGGGLSVHSPLHDWNGEFVSMTIDHEKGTYKINFNNSCTPMALDQYKLIIKKYPFWPFSHFVLAYCLKSKGDRSWKEQANIALKILQKTTAIPNHNPAHSAVLKEVEKLLQ
jgi:hypothetical protein